ncbi:Fic family protein [Fusobacterium sp.]|uniref:Fic family protein n=1 Tax=Fusobacterium sp. TaxID=68766 RepID=UPI002616B045|nr:Fic family protein [Fusobacterium sp.]
MIKSTYDVVEYEKDKKIKKENWEMAVGLNEVDGLKPSSYLKELINDSVEGKSTYLEIETKLHNYYKSQDITKQEIRDNKECDIVSTRIAEILEDGSFTFSPIYLKSIHRRLFENIFEGELEGWAGKFREINITKKEPILDGDTVTYANHFDILDYLKYDFEEEKSKDYTKLSQEQQVQRVAKFTSAIWQTHPFREGNTRTIAVFIEKYLRTKGYNVNNELFKENSVYFRNALVLSNYTNISKGINSNYEYLYSFFKKLLIDREIKLEKMNIPQKKK